MHTAKDFTTGRRVRNLKTGETGTLAQPASLVPNGYVGVVYDDSDEFGVTWITPLSKLELLPAPTYDTFPEGEG